MPTDNPPKPTKPRKPPWRFEPSQAQRDTAQALAGCGVPAREIALYFAINEKTALRVFRAELSTGRGRLHARMVAGITKMAIEGDRAALMFVLKCQFKWRETGRVEVTGKDGAPISFSDLSDDAAYQLLDALRASLGDAGVGAGRHPEDASHFDMDPPARPPN